MSRVFVSRFHFGKLGSTKWSFRACSPIARESSSTSSADTAPMPDACDERSLIPGLGGAMSPGFVEMNLNSLLWKKQANDRNCLCGYHCRLSQQAEVTDILLDNGAATTAFLLGVLEVDCTQYRLPSYPGTVFQSSM